MVTEASIQTLSHIPWQRWHQAIRFYLFIRVHHLIHVMTSYEYVEGAQRAHAAANRKRKNTPR